MSGLLSSRLTALDFAGLLASRTIAGGYFDENEPERVLQGPAGGDAPKPDIPAHPAFTDRQTRALRTHVVWLRRHGRKFLAAGELAFLGYLAKWAHPLTIDQGDRVMTLVDRVDDQRRGRL